MLNINNYFINGYETPSKEKKFYTQAEELLKVYMYVSLREKTEIFFRLQMQALSLSLNIYHCGLPKMLFVTYQSASAKMAFRGRPVKAWELMSATASCVLLAPR